LQLDAGEGESVLLGFDDTSGGAVEVKQVVGKAEL